MAYHMTCEEVLAEVWEENGEEYSSFDDYESDEGEEDDNNVYGYPNDRSGRLFAEISSDVSLASIPYRNGKQKTSLKPSIGPVSRTRSLSINLVPATSPLATEQKPRETS